MKESYSDEVALVQPYFGDYAWIASTAPFFLPNLAETDKGSRAEIEDIFFSWRRRTQWRKDSGETISKMREGRSATEAEPAASGKHCWLVVLGFHGDA